jgi:putative flippase GtrA
MNLYIKFIINGTLNTIFSYTIFSLFIYLNFHYTLASLFALIVALIFNYFTMKNFVFKKNNKDKTQFIRFMLSNSIMYIINIYLLYLLEIYYSTNMYLNGLLVAVPLAILSFFINKMIVFKIKK